MDLLLINPPRSQKGEDQVLNTAMLWIASQLIGQGFQAAVRMPSGEDLESQLSSYLDMRPRYIAISCKWWNTLYSALHIAEIIRRLDKNVPIIMGGHTATAFAKDLVDTGLVNVVFLGDVDQSITALLRNEELIGAVSNKGRFKRKKYNHISLDDVQLLPPCELTDRPDLVPGYIWTGRGCIHHCFYCAENEITGAELLGRVVPCIRRVEAVAKDIRVLRGRDHIIFDYEHPSFELTERFISDLCSKIPIGKLNCYFFSWGLPSRGLIDLLSECFNQVSICVDVQVFSEELRRELSKLRIIKPYFSDSEILEVLSYAENKKNLVIDATGIVGMPNETEENREQGLSFIESLAANFECVRDWRTSPLHVIPGTPLAEESSFYNLEVMRRSFQDFLEFTRESYEMQIPYYETSRKHHPHGVCPTGQPLAIVEFMKVANSRFEVIRQSKIKSKIERQGDYAKLNIVDSYSPLRSLMAALVHPHLVDARTLEISLGPRTWFHSSWVDYSSETGENTSTLFGQINDAKQIENLVRSNLERYRHVKLAPAPKRWGVIQDIISTREK